MPLCYAWAGDGLEGGCPDHNLVWNGAHVGCLCQMWEDRERKYPSGTDSCGRWDKHSVILFQKVLSSRGPMDSQLWSYRHLGHAKVGLLFVMDLSLSKWKIPSSSSHFSQGFSPLFHGGVITRITTSNNQMILSKELLGFYPNTGSQAGMVISKDGYSFLLFAKVTEMLKNPGTSRWAKSLANTAAK